MSYSRVYLPTGGLASYAIPWPYLAQSHVVVYDGEDVYSGDITFVTATSISLDPNISGPLQIRRETPTEPLVVFTGTHLSSTDLNLSKNQALFLIEEAADEISYNFLRALRVPLGETVDDVPAVAARAGMFLGFDEGGQPVAAIPPQSSPIDGSEAFLLDGDGLGTDGVAPYNLHRWGFLEAVTPYQRLPARGWEIRSNTSMGDDFAMSRLITQRGWNNPSVSTGGLFPNGGEAYGDDGFLYEYVNRIAVISTNNLRGGRPAATGTLNGSGGFTSIAIQTDSPYVGYNPASPPTITAVHVSGDDLGLRATADIDPSPPHGLLGTSTITAPGAGYAAGLYSLVVEPPPGSQFLDVGPNLELMREAEMDNGSQVGWVYFGGRTATSPVVNTYYGSVGAEVVDNDDLSPRGRIVVCSADDFTGTSAGNYPRAYFGQGLQVGVLRTDVPTLLLSDPGAGRVNCTGISINNADFFGIPHTWDANQTIRLQDSGASGGPFFVLDRTSASPAVNDLLGEFHFQGRNSIGGVLSYAYMRARIIDPTSGSEDGRLDFQTPVAGAISDRMHLGQGLFMTGATGVDKGLGTVNATAVYDDNVLLTCYPLEYVNTGAVDVAKWDDGVPNRVIPSQKAQRVQRTVEKLKSEPWIEMVNGKAVERFREVPVREPAFEEVPLFDDNGEPVMETVMVPHQVQRLITTPKGVRPVLEWVHRPEERQRTARVPLFDEIPAVPAQEIERTHAPMRKFLARLGTEYDPTTIEGYLKHMADKGHLTAFPNPAKYDPAKGLSTGEWLQRHTENADLVANFIRIIHERLTVLEGGPRKGGQKADA